MTGVVYQVINTVNGKSYVGQTISSDKAFDRYFGSGKLILQARKKYPPMCFEKYILEVCLTREQLDEAEKRWIAKLKPEYNISSGGVKSKVQVSDETKKLLSDRHKGKKLTEEHKRKIGESGKGKEHQKDTKERIKKSNYATYRANAEDFIVIEDTLNGWRKTYYSAGEASRDIGFNKNFFYKRLKEPHTNNFGRKDKKYINVRYATGLEEIEYINNHY